VSTSNIADPWAEPDDDPELVRLRNLWTATLIATVVLIGVATLAIVFAVLITSIPLPWPNLVGRG